MSTAGGEPRLECRPAGSASWLGNVPSLRVTGWRLGAVLGLAVATWVALGAIGDLLVTMHPPALAGRGLAQGLGTNGLGGGVDAGAATIEVWHAFDALTFSRELPSAFSVARGWLYVDFVFVALYTIGVLSLARPGGPLAGGGTKNTLAATRLLVLALAATDLLENIAALYAVAEEARPDPVLVVLFGLRVLKVFILTLPLLGLLALLLLRKLRVIVGEPRVRHGLVMARPQILVVVLILLALAYEPTADVLLDIGTTQVLSLIVVGGFMCAGLAVGSRVLIDRDRVKHPAVLGRLVLRNDAVGVRRVAGKLMAIALVGALALMALVTGWRGLWGAALVIVAVLVSSWALQDYEDREPEVMSSSSTVRLPAALGLAPVALIGIALVHWTLWADIVLRQVPLKSIAGVAMTAGACAAVAPIGGIVARARDGDDRRDGHDGLAGRLGTLARCRGRYGTRVWAVIAVVLLVPLVLMLVGTRYGDVRYPGPLALLFGAAATLNVIGTGLVIGVDWWRDEFGLPSIFKALRMRRIPVFLLLAGWLLVDTFAFADPSYHDVATSGTNARVELDAAYEDWKTANLGEASRVVPLVVVAAEGGGLRAAYWTEQVLSEVFDGSDVQPFALSGTSGGSIGIATYMARTQPLGGASEPAGVGLTDVEDADFLSAVFERWFTRDVAHALLRHPSTLGDRAGALADALTAEIPALGLPYDYAPPDGAFQPVTVFNATDLQDGCLAPITTLSDLAGPALTEDDLGCLDPDRPGTGPSGGLGFPGAADIVHDCTGRGLTFATAAVASSRSPYVTPAGRLEACTGGVFYLGDGGYVDNSGALAAAVILQRLEELVAVDNADGDTCIVPMLLQIDNGAENLIPGGQSTGNPSQLTIVFSGAAAANSARHDVAKVAAAALVQRPLVAADGTTIDVTYTGSDGAVRTADRYFRIFPLAQAGRDATVGWLLAQPSKDVLDAQVQTSIADALAVLAADDLVCR